MALEIINARRVTPTVEAVQVDLALWRDLEIWGAPAVTGVGDRRSGEFAAKCISVIQPGYSGNAIAGDWLIKEGQRVTVVSATAFAIHYERLSLKAPSDGDERG
jgi:hypothetical protein